MLWWSAVLFLAIVSWYARAKDGALLAHVNLTKFLEAIDVSIDPVVDATMEQMSMVYHSGNHCPFRRKVLTKMHNNEPIVVMILGGSVTVGAELRNARQQRWSTPFEGIMNAGWYTSRVEVHNKGVAACNINVWVNQVGMFKDADLVIVDLSVNDQDFDLQVLPHYYSTLIQLLDELPNHPALLFHQAFRSGQRVKAEMEGHCPEDYTTCCDGVLFCKRWWNMQDFVAIALNKYKVPFVSYRDLVWPNYTSPGPNVDQFWNGLSHPDYKAHRLFAKLISYGIFMQMKDAHRATCDNPDHQHYVSSSQRDDSAKPLCPNPLSSMLATDSSDSQGSFSVVHAGEFWRWYSDSKNKFGYILETNGTAIDAICQANSSPITQGEILCPAAVAAHTLSLRVQLRAERPTIQLKYLKSYASEMGVSRVWIDSNTTETANIASRWPSPYSVQNVATMSKSKLGGYNNLLLGEAHVLSSLEGGEHIVHIAPVAAGDNRKFKWKLIGVTSC